MELHNDKSISPMVVYEYDKIKYTVFEDQIGRVGQTVFLSYKDFADLRSLVLQQEDEAKKLVIAEQEIEEMPCMKLSVDKSKKETLTVQNYVGTIRLPSGKIIEILPKVFVAGQDDQNARKLVTNMLRTCGIISYKESPNASIGYDKMSIFDIYIYLFIKEVYNLYKHGLKFGYVQQQENEKFFKGKLLFSQHVKYNFAHAERFFIEYDEFNVNRPENKLIKTTMEYLRHFANAENKRQLHRLCMIFDEVEKSNSIDSDFQKCTGGRNMIDYKNVLSFCKVFLKGCSFTNYSGKHDTVALLFPMEKLFEKYVAKLVSNKLNNDYVVSEQQRGKYLFNKFDEQDKAMFALKPDIHVADKNKNLVLLDTKWKRLNEDESKNFGISQADMYQMHAYYTRFDKVKTVILVYPTLKKDNIKCWSYGDEKVFAYSISVDEKIDVEKLCDRVKEFFNLDNIS